MIKKSILLIDDEETILQGMAYLLEQEGYEVSTAQSGEEGLEIFRKEEPHLVITDLMMEGIGGIEVLTQIKEISPKTMVMILTGYGEMESAIDALHFGASEYLFKPCKNSELLHRVANCMEKLTLQWKVDQHALALERSNNDLKDFASIVAHDLQEPLRKIVTFGDMLKEKIVVTDEQGCEFIERMQKSTVRMQNFINDLLDFSKVTTRAKPFEPTDYRVVICQVLEDLETRISQTGGVINLRDLPILDSDPFQIRQLFQNLIGNALKFHQEGVPPVININSQRGTDNKSWDITVEDNGIGFNEKYLSRIFLPFERLHGHSEFEGNGMGLAICQKIVARHGGTITAKSTPKKGSTIIITLPEEQYKLPH